MSHVGELNGNPPTLSTLLDCIARSDSVNRRLQLLEKECESLRQEQQLIYHQEQLIMEHFLPSDSMSLCQVEAGNELIAGEQRNLRLQFRNKLPQEIDTGFYIKTKELTSIGVELVDASGRVVTSGPEASATGEIVLCRYDQGSDVNWTTEDFNNSIIVVWENNKPLLLGELQFNLNEGIGTIGNIKFKHCKDWVKKREFMLGARVVNKFTGVQIKEAKTEPFKIKDRRNGYYSKRDTLTLEDEIYRLKNISYKGGIYPRLQKEHISTMKDFLNCLFTEPAKLQEIVGLPLKKFNETIKHAQNGMINDRLCCYSDLDGKMMVVFDFVSQVLGVVFGERYYHFLELSDENKANAQKLAIQALQHWKDVRFVDSMVSLLQKFPVRSTEKVDSSSKGIDCSETSFGSLSGVLLNNSNGADSMDERCVQQLKLLEAYMLSDETASPSGNYSAYNKATVEDCHEELKQDYIFEFHANDKQKAITNVEPIRCPKPWIFMRYVVIWKRVMLKNYTSTKRDCPRPATSAIDKKQKVC